jgi:hypothetical protein
VIEIRKDPDGQIDEIVGPDFHLERMADNYLHLIAGDWHIQIVTEYHPIIISAEKDE